MKCGFCHSCSINNLQNIWKSFILKRTTVHHTKQSIQQSSFFYLRGAKAQPTVVGKEALKYNKNINSQSVTKMDFVRCEKSSCGKQNKFANNHQSSNILHSTNLMVRTTVCEWMSVGFGISPSCKYTLWRAMWAIVWGGLRRQDRVLPFLIEYCLMMMMMVYNFRAWMNIGNASIDRNNNNNSAADRQQVAWIDLEREITFQFDTDNLGRDMAVCRQCYVLGRGMCSGCVSYQIVFNCGTSSWLVRAIFCLDIVNM